MGQGRRIGDDCGRSAFPTIAGISLRCRELAVWATSRRTSEYWVGTEQKRTYIITDEGLRLTDNVKLPDGTGPAVEILWKRLY